MDGRARNPQSQPVSCLDTFETHYALYPPGAGYQRHLDRFQDNPLRTISVVSYLNTAWQPGDGGELRLYLPDGEFDVAPRAGTVVVFTSADVEHEVLASRFERASLTGWFSAVGRIIRCCVDLCSRSFDRSVRGKDSGQRLPAWATRAL
ncbi:2OG-Fe(II) oxygenase [Halopseudomonas pachastrellae]|nr:2OG-Fe(II) oxygenase [Halopseudomonas pachastrellae]